MRILGITIPEDKKITVALTAIYGIGNSQAEKIITDSKVDKEKKTKDLTSDDENTIRKIIEAIRLEGDLRREVSNNIKRLKDIKSYRGSRHTKSLPTRGQRTKSNSRTRRGNVRKTMGTGRRAADKK